LLVFVVAPLQASGVVTGRYFGLIFGLVLVPAAFMLAANWVAAGSIFSRDCLDPASRFSF